MIGVPVVVFLAILVLFGVTWMFHHHYWKPVVGGLLFVFGIAFLVMFGWVVPRRMEMSRQSEAVQMDEINRSEEMRRADEQQLAQAHSKQSVDHQPSGAVGASATGHEESSSDRSERNRLGTSSKRVLQNRPPHRRLAIRLERVPMPEPRPLMRAPLGSIGRWVLSRPATASRRPPPRDSIRRGPNVSGQLSSP